MGPITSLSDLVSALRRRFWLILLILGVGLPVSVVFALSQPRLYEATAVIQIEAPEVTVTATGQVQGLTADGQLDLITQNLMSRDHMLGVIERFQLFADLPTPTERVAALRGAVSIVKLVDPALAWRADVQPSGLSITVRLGDSQAAADVANDFLAAVLAEARSRSEGRASRTLAFLLEEEARVATEIAAVEDGIATFRAGNVESLPEGLTAQRDRLTRLNETRLALDQQIIALAGETGRLRAEDVATQMALLTEQLALVNQDIAQIEAAIAAAPAVERDLSAMTRTLTQLEAELTVLTTRRTEAAMAQLLEQQDHAERFEVLETAIEPDYPVSASRKKIALAGAMAVVLAALGLAAGIEILHPAIRTAAQLERQLGIQPVIVVPVLQSQRGRWLRRLGWGAGLAGAAAAVWAILRGLGAALVAAAGSRRPAALQS